MGSRILFLLLIGFLGIQTVFAVQWPVPYNYTKSRPAEDPRCIPYRQQICPGGQIMPSFFPDDELLFYAMSRQTEELKYTPMKTNIARYALGIHSVNTKKFYVVRYEPMSGWFNASIPRIGAKNELIWCDQTEVCVQLDNQHKEWTKVQHIANMSGDRFDDLTVWIQHVNLSQPYYQEFLVVQGLDDKDKHWMLPYEGQSFLSGAINLLRQKGAIIQPVTLTYTFYTLFCDQPTLLGNASTIQKHRPKDYTSMIEFYRTLQPATGMDALVKKWEFYWKVHWKNEFYYYFNQAYWYLHLRKPYLKVSVLNHEL